MNHHGSIGASALTAVLAVLLSVTSSAAQSNAWTSSDKPADGAAIRQAPSPDALVTASCGTPGANVVRSESSSLETSSTNFASVPGASATVAVPAGQTRCIKVVFTGEAACGGSGGTDFCYIRALDNGNEMDPRGDAQRAFVSEDSSAEAHAYEWIRRVGAGNHTIVVQGRVASSNSTFFLDDWTLDVQVLQ